MRVALRTIFAASKKEPFGEQVGRIRRAFIDAGLGEPEIRFTFADSFLTNAVSSIDRVLKRHPDMERFLQVVQRGPGSPEGRQLSNVSTGEAADVATVEAIADGVPRSYPFRAIGMHFYAPLFGARLIGLPKIGHSYPGVMLTDNWWVNGRQRYLTAYTVAEAEEGDKKLPPNPEAVDAVIKACGKAKKTEQVPILVPGGPVLRVTPSIPPANADAVTAIVADYRVRIKEVVVRAALPHDLPPATEIRTESAGVKAGPRKPAIQAAFKPMGYSCRGGSGELHLTRRTSGNLTVELALDVGTWSHEVSAVFLIQGAGFKASLGVPVAPRAYGQYPIGDAAQWQKIVDNLAAMVRELERSFVPEIEQAAGPSPAWYQPAS